MKKDAYHIACLGCFVLSVFNLGSCKKFVTVPPPTDQLVAATVFSDDATATAAITGIYSNMMSSNGFASMYLTVYGGLLSDELTLYSTSSIKQEFYKNQLSAVNGDLAYYFWSQPYQYIYAANAVLEGLQHSTTLSEKVKLQLNGEARFIRAFCYFYLTNLFGDVPYLTTTDYQANNITLRSSQDSVYQALIEDLKMSKGELPGDFNISNGERTRPNRWAAAALLARVYLYNQEWHNAELESDSILAQTALFSLSSDLSMVFLKNSTESIWQLMPVSPGYNTWEGNYLILLAMPRSVALSSAFMNVFEDGDLRRITWTDSLVVSGTTYYYPFKYRVKTSAEVTEYQTVFRLAEQYLIRSEARAHQNDLSGAQSDLNIIRSRAGLNDTHASTGAEIQNAILQERRVELFQEWGQRWFDLKRTGTALSALQPIKTTIESKDLLFPIPSTQLRNDPFITQNAGY